MIYSSQIGQRKRLLSQNVIDEEPSDILQRVRHSLTTVVKIAM